MTRIAVFGVLVLAAVGRAPADDKKDVPKELAPFQGTWKVVRAEAGGEAMPAKETADTRFIFKGDQLDVQEGGRPQERPDTVTVDPKKEPAQLVLKGGGEETRMIYKFDKDGRLTLCFVKEGKVPPKEFKTAPKSEAVLMVLEKVKE